MLKGRAFKAILLGSAMLAAGGAHAQATDPQSGTLFFPGPDAQHGGEGDDQSANPDAVSDGEKRAGEGSPIVTPSSISIVPSERFQDMGALTLQDTLRYSAGVRTEAYGLDPRGDFGFVRGIEPSRYHDGLRRTFGFRAGPRPEIFMLSSVEILRGPSSMLFGQGSTGGLINLVSKRPLFETAGEMFASYGSYDRKEIGVDITGPILGEALAGRLVGVWRESDSQTDFVGERRIAINPSLTLRPGPDTQLTVIGMIQDDESGWAAQFLPYAATLGAPDGKQLPWGTNLGEPSEDRFNISGEWVAINFSHQFSHVVELRQNARYERFRSDQRLHYPESQGISTNPFISPGDSVVNQFFPEYAAVDTLLNRIAFAERFKATTFVSDTQLEFDFDTGPFVHKILTGMDYSRFVGRSRSAFGASSALTFFGAPGAVPIDAFAPTYGNVVAPIYQDDPRQEQTQLGFYAQAQSRAFDRIVFVLGLRRDRAVNDIPNGGRLVDKATTTRGGVMIDAGADLVPYYGYSESFQPVAGIDLFGSPFRPQRGSQHELGLKWQPSRAVTVNAAVYQLEDRNRLVADPANALNSIQTGAVRTRGFEIEALAALPGDFDITATYSYAEARDRDQGGRQFEGVPRHLASLWGTKYIAVGQNASIQMGTGLRYVGNSVSYSFSGGPSGLLVTTPDYLLADALLAIGRGPWTLSVNAANLFDKKYYTTCLGRGDCFLGQRRTINAALGFRF